MEATTNKPELKRNGLRSSLLAGRIAYQWRLQFAPSLNFAHKSIGSISRQAVGVGKCKLPRRKLRSGNCVRDSFLGERRGEVLVTRGNPTCSVAMLRKLLRKKRIGLQNVGLVGRGIYFSPECSQLCSAAARNHHFGEGAALPAGSAVDSAADEGPPKYKHVQESREQIFVRVVQHELLTPLSGVVGMLDLVDNKGLLDPKGKLSLKHAKDSARALVEQLLLIMEYTSLVERQSALTFQNVQLPLLLRELTASWRGRAEAKGLKFVVQILPGAPLSLRADLHCFRRLMEILLSNAVKFTHSGEVAIGVGPGPRIWVRDSGIGIAQELQAVIFQPFRQVDESWARKHPGMGLGLAVAYHLAKAMKGLLSVTSQPGKGSIFSFNLAASVKKPV